MSAVTHDDRWFVVQTHPGAEDKAEINLRRQGFEFYTPRYLKKRSHARKVEMVSAPLFPRYLFVKMDPAAIRWRSIRSTIGVRDLVCVGDDPTPVPAGIVEALMANEDDQGYIGLGSRDEFIKGQEIEIVDGPLADMAAVVELVDDKDRVVVLLSLLGRQVRTRVPLKDIRSAA